MLNDLTPDQRIVFAADVRADPVLSLILPGGDNALIIAYAYAITVSPSYYVYRSSLSRQDLITITSPEGTTFTWAGGGYITRSQGERDAFREMFNIGGFVDPSKSSIQMAFNDIFSGSGGLSNRTHVAAMSKRQANRLEKLFAVGAGTLAAPSLMGAEGRLTYQTVSATMGW